MRKRGATPGATPEYETPRTLTLKPAEVAVELRVARAAVYRLIASGDLPSLRVGKSIRVSSESLRAWIKAKESGR